MAILKPKVPNRPLWGIKTEAKKMNRFYPAIGIVIALIFLFFVYSGIQQVRAFRADIQAAKSEMPQKTLEAIEKRYGVSENDMKRFLGNAGWAAEKFSSLSVHRLSGVEFIYHNFGPAKVIVPERS